MISEKLVGIVGVGPSAITLALLLFKSGYSVVLYGLPKESWRFESISLQVISALNNIGINIPEKYRDQSWVHRNTWGGNYKEGQGNIVVCRRDLDIWMLKQLEVYGIRIVYSNVLDVTSVESGWCVYYCPIVRPGEVERAFHEFIVDASDLKDPKRMANEAEGILSIVMSCKFTSASMTKLNETIIEPFDNGWAWIVKDKWGNGLIQIIVDSTCFKLYRAQLSNIWSTSFQNLPYSNARLGKFIRVSSEMQVAKSMAVLRKDRVGSNYIRVGDACYSSDPLSGYGLFDVIAGAYSALRVLEVLLNSGKSKDIAFEYYNNRVRFLFWSRMSIAEEFYADEQRWAKSVFWVKRRSRLGDRKSPHGGTAYRHY